MTGPPLHAPSTVCPPRQLGPVSRSCPPFSHHPTGSISSSPVVGAAFPLSIRGFALLTPPSTLALSGCLHRGLGCPSRISPDLRCVKHITEVSPHQQLGTAGSPPCPSALPNPADQQVSSGDGRQHYSSGPDQEPSRHPLTVLVPPDCTPPQMGR